MPVSNAAGMGTASSPASGLGGGVDQRFPDDPGRRHRLGQALQLEVAHGLEHEAAAASGQGSHQFGGEDLAGGGDGAQPAGLDHRHAEHVVVLDAHVADAQPDADLERLGVDGLLDGHRGGHRFGGGGEGGHQAVAQALDDGAAVVGDGGREQLVVAAAQRVGLLLTEPDAQLGRVHEIGEQHRPRIDLSPRGAHVVVTAAFVTQRGSW